MKIMMALMIMLVSCSLFASDSTVTIEIYTSIGRYSYDLSANVATSNGEILIQTHDVITMGLDREFTVNKITAIASEFPEYEFPCYMDGPYDVEAGKILLIEFSKNKLDVC